MYRFLISRKTFLLLAAIWIVSGLLLFVAGWLLGRHESAPLVDSESLAAMLDAGSSTRATSTGEPSSKSRRRDAKPWRNLSTAPPPSTPTPSAPPPSASAPPPSSTPASSAPPPSQSASPDSSSAPPSTSSADSASSSAPAASSGEDPSPVADGSAPGSSKTPSAESSPGAASDLAAFSLQIGAFASKENAEVKIDEATTAGLAPYLVPVIDADRTLYTVRVGRYASRELALQAAEELRSSKGIAAVIRSVDPS